MSSKCEIPFIFAPKSKAGIDPDRLEPLRYEMVAHKRIQRQFRKRKLIWPCIDLDRYKFKALIDWIEIEIRTEERTNFQTVQRRLNEVLDRDPWVRPRNGERHGADTKFTARIQKPDRKQLLAIVPTLERSRFGLAGPIGIKGIEVAVDVRPKSGELRDRLAMVVLLQRHVLVSRPDWTDRYDDGRYVSTLPSGGSSKPSYVIQGIRGKAGSGADSDQKIGDALVRERILRVKSHRAPFIDSTLYFGREGGPAMVSIEHKMTDSRDPGKGTFVALTDDECCARIEVRLQGEALEELGLRQLEDVFGFRYETLRKPFFAFWLPTVPNFGEGMERLDTMIIARHIEMFENSGVYGLERFEQAQRERLRQEALTENRRSRRGDHDFDVQVPGKPRATVRFKRESFVDLNENVRVALRTLSRSMDVNQKADDKDEGSPLILRMAA